MKTRKLKKREINKMFDFLIKSIQGDKWILV